MEHIVGPVFVFGTGLGIVGTVALIAWIYEKTRPKMEHPSLGRLTFSAGSWWGMRARGEQSVRFELPGDKSGPDSEAVEKFAALWGDLAEILSALKPVALEELRSTFQDWDDSEKSAIESELEVSLTEVEGNLEGHWLLSEIALKDMQTDPGSEVPRWCWNLEFEVSWDPEHGRTAYLDLDRELLYYDLSCVVYLLD